MTTLQDAAQQLIDFHDGPTEAKRHDVFIRRIESIRTALAQQGQEPVAYMDNDGNVSDNNDHGTFNTPLYTAAPAPQAQPVVNQQMTTVKESLTPQPTQPAQPLTEPEIHAMAHRKATHYKYTAKRSEVMYGFSEGHIVDFVRAIEKARGL